MRGAGGEGEEDQQVTCEQADLDGLRVAKRLRGELTNDFFGRLEDEFVFSKPNGFAAFVESQAQEKINENVGE